VKNSYSECEIRTRPGFLKHEPVKNHIQKSTRMRENFTRKCVIFTRLRVEFEEDDIRRPSLIYTDKQNG
jgi:hypothetical protein